MDHQLKKIAIVVCAWPPQGGGIGNNAYHHAQLLAQNPAYQVTVFTLGGSAVSSTAQANLTIIRAGGWPRYGHAGFIWSLWHQLAGFDLVHLYYPFFGTDLIIGWYKLWHRRLKLVLHYQMDPLGQGWQAIFFRLYLSLFLPPLLWLSDRLIILSTDHASHSYLAWYYRRRPDKFTIVPNGIDAKLFCPGPANTELKSQIGLPETEKIILFVGGLDRQHYFKGLSVLFKALAQLPLELPVKLMVIGDGPWRHRYQREAIVMGLEQKVVFLGWVENEKLNNYYRLADLFVLPSTAATESFGIVIAEAQACGVPALVSDWPGSRQTIVDQETGVLVSPGAADVLAQKIEELLIDSSRRQHFGRQAAERARRLYDWSVVLPSLTRVYDQLVSPTVLDLGCGNGDYTAYLAQAGAQVVGVDIDITLAKERYPALDFRQMASEQIDLPANYFAAVYARDVFEHVPDIDQTLAEVARVLEPGGYLVATVPTEQSENSLLKLNPNYWSTIGHRRIITGQAWAKLLERHGLDWQYQRTEKFFTYLIVWLMFKLGHQLNSQKGDFEPTKLYKFLLYLNLFFDQDLVWRTRAKYIPLWLVTLPLAWVGNKFWPKTLLIKAVKIIPTV